MNLSDILDYRSPEIMELFRFMEKTGENINDHIGRQKSLLTNDIFLDNHEVCELLHLSSRTLQDYRDKGLIAFYKLEGKILYKMSDVKTMLEKNYFNAWKQRGL